MNDFSFKLYEKEVIGIFGSNGAGKSTVFNLITGFLKPDSGDVLYKGQDITGMPPVCYAFPYGRVPGEAGDRVLLFALSDAVPRVGELFSQQMPPPSPPAAVAISRAIRLMRLCLSPGDPSFCWNVTLSSRAARLASVCLRSWFQKKDASSRRGRMTRSLPACTCRGSRLSILATVMKCGISAPVSSMTGKNFW